MGCLPSDRDEISVNIPFTRAAGEKIPSHEAGQATQIDVHRLMRFYRPETPRDWGTDKWT